MSYMLSSASAFNQDIGNYTPANIILDSTLTSSGIELLVVGMLVR
jgi:hypothetical protein